MYLSILNLEKRYLQNPGIGVAHFCVPPLLLPAGAAILKFPSPPRRAHDDMTMVARSAYRQRVIGE